MIIISVVIKTKKICPQIFLNITIGNKEIFFMNKIYCKI